MTAITMTKALSAAVFLSAALAAPVFAQEAGTMGPRSYNDWNFRGAHNGQIYRSQVARRNQEDFGFTGRDRSRPGGWDPHLYLNRPRPGGWDPDPTPSGGGN
jgi:hypothetical protein